MFFLLINLGSITVLALLSLTKPWKWAVFPFFRLSVISFRNVLWSSVCTFCVKFIAKCSYCFWCYKWNRFLNFIFGLFLASYIEIQFSFVCSSYISQSSWSHVLILIICMCSLGSSICQIYSFASRPGFTSFLFVCLPSCSVQNLLWIIK